jgi:hypothetical protein
MKCNAKIIEHRYGGIDQWSEKEAAGNAQENR